MAGIVRVLIADDHQIVRKGIRALLAAKHDIAVVGEAGDGETAVALAAELEPDVVLMDLQMPRMGGIEATRAIVAAHPKIAILVLTSFASEEHIFPAIRAGARGFILKETGPQELLEAIRRVHRGEPALDPSVARKVLAELSGAPARQEAPAALTAREVGILRLIAQGQSNKEMAGSLGISEETVHSHVSNILGKLHLASRTQAALYAIKEGIASLDEVPKVE